MYLQKPSKNSKTIKFYNFNKIKIHFDTNAYYFLSVIYQNINLKSDKIGSESLVYSGSKILFDSNMRIPHKLQFPWGHCCHHVVSIPSCYWLRASPRYMSLVTDSEVAHLLDGMFNMLHKLLKPILLKMHAWYRGYIKGILCYFIKICCI